MIRGDEIGREGGMGGWGGSKSGSSIESYPLVDDRKPSALSDLENLET